MKLSNLTVGLLVVTPLTMIGCPGEDDGPAAGGASASGATADPFASSGADPSATSMGVDPSGADASATSMGADTTGDTAPSCQDPQEIPEGPDCTGVDGVLEGSVTIEEGGDSIAVLQGIVEVTGSVHILSTDVVDLSFMECLETVGGDVTIFGNEQLVNVDGLWSLSSVGTHFIFSSNNALTDFDGLPNVVEVPDNLVMRNNAALVQVSGFHSLTTVHNLVIQNNDVLINIDGVGGLTTLTAIEVEDPDNPGQTIEQVGVFAVTNNPVLCVSSIDCVVAGITEPPELPPRWPDPMPYC
ncbi:MAG: hypothetical protein K0V04_05410 [Deltaproteobacteria bacterium]|nr:hypothetical protein [Deltaproteobacteria bacterium]